MNFDFLEQITFNLLVKIEIVENKVIQVEVLEFRKGSGLHGSWLCGALLEYMQGKTDDCLFITYQSDKFSFKKDNLLEVLEVLEQIFALQQ